MLNVPVFKFSSGVYIALTFFIRRKYFLKITLIERYVCPRAPNEMGKSYPFHLMGFVSFFLMTKCQFFFDEMWLQATLYER
jgi:hypothetical protein